MKRREILALGAATAAASSAGCAGWTAAAGGSFDASSVREGAGESFDIASFIASLDQKLSAIVDPLAKLLSQNKRTASSSSAAVAGDPRTADLVRKSLKSLVLVSAFHDLPEPARLHPAIQSRMWNAMPDMDDAVTGMTALLSSLTPAQRQQAEHKLKDDPGLTMRVAESIDEHARGVGINARGRGRLRGAASALSWRMRHQPASLVLDDYVGKMHRIVARRGSDAQRERLLALEVTQAAFWSSLAARTAEQDPNNESPESPDIPEAPRDTSTSTTSADTPNTTVHPTIEGEEADVPGAPRINRDPPAPPRVVRKLPPKRTYEPPKEVEAPRGDHNDASNALLLGGLGLGLGLGSIAGGYVIAASGFLGLLGITIGLLAILLGISLIVGGIVSLVAAGVEKATEGRDVDLPGT